MAAILGKDVMFYVVRNGVDVPICYAESMTITLTGEAIEATKAVDSYWRNYTIGLLTYTIECSGVIVDDDTNTYNLNSMEQVFINRESVNWKCKDLSNPLKQYSGTAVLPSVIQDSSAEDFAKFTLSAQGDGAYIITYTLPGINGRIYYKAEDVSGTMSDFDSYTDADPNNDIYITFPDGTAEKYLKVAYTKGAQLKTDYQDVSYPLNAGTIGGESDLFEVTTVDYLGNPLWHIGSRYKTTIGGNPPQLRLYIRSGTQQIDPPSNVQATFEYVDDDNATIHVSYTESISSGVTGYQIRLTNLTDSTVEYFDAASDLTYDISVIRGKDFLVAVRSYIGSDFATSTAVSAWTSDVPLSILSSADIENITFTIANVNTFGNYKIIVSATGTVNTNVLVTYEYGDPGSRIQDSLTVVSGTNGSIVSGLRTNPIIISLSPTSSGNQVYNF